ncbi:FMN-dependent NADH-azoreductase [Aliiruegeria sabulilitoris]|uniref:FMN-dependent NADH-azoreductase n=1 Tax=Aliiruegeria sabulilitoris TaxID=1510458 RepID=UPI000834063E|nr:NAD(P)H-dependent oxidoreductase [Aliiruegeria sabulilitoris]NDR59384.1 FMN-dependent NADH-azoreductase [Pseudoruegeria sp. M32A2M]
MTAPTILKIDSSARLTASVSRDLTTQITEKFDGARIIARDLATAPLPQIDEGFVTVTKGATEDEVSEAQREMLALSNTLIDELRQADVIVIGLPVYNFGLPASLKAWIDLVARAGETFKYSEAGPEGLLTGKRVIIAMASGGTEANSAIDFATPYLRHVLGFMGMTDVELVRADRLAFDVEGTIKAAKEQVATLAA